MNNNHNTLLQAVSPELKYIGGLTLKNPFGFSISRAKMYAVIGENGCGKSTLGKIITNGWNFTTNVIIGDKQSLSIEYVEFSDIHSLTGFSGAYYQQRFESMMNDEIPTVGQLIDGKIDPQVWHSLCQKLNVDNIINKRINYLSSGELRKFLIINILTTSPDILIIDNPYIGLDAESRNLLNELLQQIIDNGTTIVMLLCNSAEIPHFTNFVIPMKCMEIGETIAVTSDNHNFVLQQTAKLFTSLSHSPLPQWNVSEMPHFKTAFSLTDCNVMYGENTILHNVNWEVCRGEKWALLGENGSGKSTLLSLVCCDNPQGYCNNITIFDRQRGSGESIWDIKRHISYISPEMHLYFNSNKDVTEVVASGLHDMKGLYVKASAEQRTTALQIMQSLAINHLAERRFNTLSSGEQRMVLIAKTLIKKASILILDEPLHGLDEARKQWLKCIINNIASSPEVTLIYVSHYLNEIPQAVNKTFRLSPFKA